MLTGRASAASNSAKDLGGTTGPSLSRRPTPGPLPDAPFLAWGPPSGAAASVFQAAQAGQRPAHRLVSLPQSVQKKVLAFLATARR